jgi:hypothetical protein
MYDAGACLLHSLGPCHSRQAEGLTGNPALIQERWFCSGFPIARVARVGNDNRVSYELRHTKLRDT